MARSVSFTRLVPLIAVAILAVAWQMPRPVPARGSDERGTAQLFAGAAIGGTAVHGFALAVDPVAAVQPESPYTRVCSNVPAYLSGLWGSYIQGDRFEGRLQSPPLLVAAPYWYLPIIGYPSRHGNRLYVEVRSADGSMIQRLTYRGANPGEALELWPLDLRLWRGATARVVLEDGTNDPTGWLGVGAPIATERAGATMSDLSAGVTDYDRYWLTGLVLAALIFIPGMALRRWSPRGWGGETALLPVPGILLLAGYGVILWRLDAGSNGLARHILLIGEGLLAASCCWPKRALAGSRDRQRGGADRPGTLAEPRGLQAYRDGPLHHSYIWTIYAGAVILAAGYCVARRPVTQEWSSQTTFQSRMVASPPDHLIPYATGAYFHAGYDGRDHSEPYFGGSFVAARGPLAPWMINAAFNVLRVRPNDPPEPTADAWPAGADGFYVARWIGLLTNACIVAGVAALTLALGGRVWFAAIWAGVAPVTFVNLGFVWPKLFAAYFLVLAAADCLRGKPIWRLAAWTALAYLCHPIGGLFALSLGLLTGRSRGWRIAARYALLTGALLSPWLLFKFLLHRSDPFFRYPLGDGHGYQAAASLGSWIAARWHNLWYTLVPGAFTFSRQMRSWSGYPLGEPARWAIQAAKTLPGNLGSAGCAVAYFALARLGWKGPRQAADPRVLRLVGWFLLPSFLTMLLYWGFSGDGLGRNCLEPLSVALIAWAAAARPLSIRMSALVLGFIAVETMAVVVFGFL